MIIGDTFSPKNTGLPYIIGIYDKIICLDWHIKRPKVVVLVDNEKTIAISIEDKPKCIGGRKSYISPEEYAIFVEWITRHKQVLLDYFEGRLFDTFELIKILFNIDICTEKNK